jgi:hemerythrin-like domain-containing protein
MKTTALKLMSAEHLNIEIVVKSLQDAVAALDQCQRLNVQKLRSVVDFLRVYADERHHQREEALFFPILVKRGVPAQGCPIAGLNHEHEKGRALVTSLGEEITFYEQRQLGADQALRQTLQGIMDLYRKHLWMEDVMVFPMAEKRITESDDKELKQKFADLDRKIGLEAIKRSENFARSLCLQTGTSVPAGAKAVTVSADCECNWS